MNGRAQQVEEHIRPVIRAMGYDLVGVEYRQGAGQALLRVYIDSESGITLDDCEHVSHQVSSVLDVEDPIPGAYNLEVSSPGLDRPLFTPEQCRRFIGQRVKLRLHEVIEGRRRFTATLREVQENAITVEHEGERLDIPWETVARAKLVPELN